MPIDRLSIAGPDEAVRPQELAELSARYPFVEWSILYGRPFEPRRRFPSVAWIRELTEISAERARTTGSPSRLSLHLCGAAVASLIRDERDVLTEILPLIPSFQRIQLNVDYRKVAASLPTLPRVLRKLRPAPQFIVQLNGKAINEEVGENLRANGLDVAFLYDESGGQGITPESWRAPKGDYCGYAGGLSLANIETQIPRIREAAGSARVYLDLEAGARDAQDRFDMDAVKLLLETVAPHIDA